LDGVKNNQFSSSPFVTTVTIVTFGWPLNFEVGNQYSDFLGIFTGPNDRNFSPAATGCLVWLRGSGVIRGPIQPS
jgi:hypothetical protein